MKYIFSATIGAYEPDIKRCEIFKKFEKFYGYAHAKVKKSVFSPKILELVSNNGIFLSDFQIKFYSILKIRVKLTSIKNPETLEGCGRSSRLWTVKLGYLWPKEAKSIEWVIADWTNHKRNLKIGQPVMV